MDVATCEEAERLKDKIAAKPLWELLIPRNPRWLLFGLGVQDGLGTL